MLKLYLKKHISIRIGFDKIVLCCVYAVSYDSKFDFYFKFCEQCNFMNIVNKLKRYSLLYYSRYKSTHRI